MLNTPLYHRISSLLCKRIQPAASFAALVLLSTLAACTGNSQSTAINSGSGVDNAQVQAQQEQSFIGDLLARMTLEEKVAQMIQAEIAFGVCRTVAEKTVVRKQGANIAIKGNVLCVDVGP